MVHFVFFSFSLFQVDEAVFCAGQIALVPCTMHLVKAGTFTQTQLTLSHVTKVLEAVINGLTLEHVVQAHCYTTQHQDSEVIRNVWDNMLKSAGEEQVSHFGVEFWFLKYMNIEIL